MNSLILALTPILFVLILIVTPLVYLTLSTALHLGYSLGYLYLKIPPDGELYRTYVYRDSLVIALTGYDFGPIANTLILSSIVSTVSVLVATVTSVTCLSLSGAPRILLGYVAPLIASIPAPLISAYAIVHLFHRDFGLVNVILGELLGVRISLEGIAGVALYQIINFFPIAHLIVFTYMDSMDRSVVEAAYSLGSRGLSVVSRIVIPLSKPAILVAFSLTFVLSAEDLSGPIAFSRYNSARNVLSYQAYYDFISEYGYTVSVRAVTYVTLLSLIAVLVFITSWRYLKLYTYPIVSPAKLKVDLAPYKLPLLLVTILLVAVAVTPTILVLGYSITGGWFGSVTPRSLTPENYAMVLQNPYYARALLNTLAYVALALLITIPVAYTIAYSSVRSKSILSPIVEVSSVLPIVVPGIAVGIGYFALFHTFFKEIPPLDPMVNPAPYLVLAYASRRLTYAARPLVASIQKIPSSLEEQALNLGARLLRVIRTIILPLLLNPTIVGASIASIHMATEFSVSVVLAGGYGVSASHPSPVTPVILNSITYNSLSMHQMSALLVTTITLSIAISILLSLTLTWALSGLKFRDLMVLLRGY